MHKYTNRLSPLLSFEFSSTYLLYMIYPITPCTFSNSLLFPSFLQYCISLFKFIFLVNWIYFFFFFFLLDYRNAPNITWIFKPTKTIPSLLFFFFLVWLKFKGNSVARQGSILYRIILSLHSIFAIYLMTYNLFF